MQDGYTPLILPDEVRHPICADNPDMDRIESAFVTLETLRDIYLQLGLPAFAMVWKVFIETIYTMGYQAGKAAAEQDAMFDFESGGEDSQ